MFDLAVVLENVSCIGFSWNEFGFQRATEIAYPLSRGLTESQTTVAHSTDPTTVYRMVFLVSQMYGRAQGSADGGMDRTTVTYLPLSSSSVCSLPATTSK
jgi:hypothetical protein